MRTMNIQDERDANLIVVAAVEGYGMRHNMSSDEVLKLFNSKGIIELIRSQYDVLHTLDLSESAEFAEDILNRKVN